MPDDDPNIIHAVLHYFYHFDYDIECVDGSGTLSGMPFNIRVFALAQKYDIEPLMVLAKKYFNADADDVADGESVGDGFSRAVKLFYEETADCESHQKTLHDDMVRFAKTHFKTLMEEDPGFKTVMQEVGGFAADVAAALELHNRACKGMRKYRCSRCKGNINMDIPYVAATDGALSIWCPLCGHHVSRSAWVDSLNKDS